MRRPFFAILAISFGVAGCGGGGGSNSSSQATNQASSAAAAPTTEEAVASDLPVYPGAVKDANLSLTTNRCGHKATATTYIVKDDLKTVSDWYADRMPGGVRENGVTPMPGGTTIEMAAVYDPSGSRVALVSKNHFGPGIPASVQNIENATAVHVILETVAPPFSPSELQDAEAMVGGDAATKQRLLAKTKCE